eukprot:451538_1
MSTCISSIRKKDWIQCACCHQRMQCRQITKDAVRCNSGFDRREWTQRRATTADTDEPTTDNTYAIRTDHDQRELDKEEIQLMTYKSYLERRVAYLIKQSIENSKQMQLFAMELPKKNNQSVIERIGKILAWDSVI